jgi:hypothetical protein
MLTNKKAVSTIILIILILCSTVVGALLSYMWVMGNFYLEPETVGLVITNVDFPVDHADYFYVTVMNPSHSPSGTNITEIYFTGEGDNKLYNVTDTSPKSLPITLERGTSETIKCLLSWGEFAGKIITVHVSASSASGAVVSIKTSFVKLGLEIKFDAAVSCKHFNVTITNNPQSAINLTLTKLLVNLVPIETAKRLADGQNVTISGINLSITGQPISLQCLYDWETLSNPKVRVETSEGYYAEATPNATATVLLLITNVAFNETNPNDMSITVDNSAVSRTAVDITDIVLTYRNGTANQEYHINGSKTNPLFAPYYHLRTGKNVTFDHCAWNWTNFRDQNVTLTVNVKQGFTPASETVKTPDPVIFKITELNFNLNDTNHFLMKVASMPCSLGNTSIEKITVNGTEAAFEYQIIHIDEEKTFNCTFDWRSFRGKDANITAYRLDGQTLLKIITLPSVDLKIVINEHDFAASAEGIAYVNFTIENTLFSNRTVNITQVIFKTGNMTDTIDGTLTNPMLSPNGYILNIGANVTICCPWNWTLYANQTLTITVQTKEGFSISQTFQIPAP